MPYRKPDTAFHAVFSQSLMISYSPVTEFRRKLLSKLVSGEASDKELLVFPWDSSVICEGSSNVRPRLFVTRPETVMIPSFSVTESVTK